MGKLIINPRIIQIINPIVINVFFYFNSLLNVVSSFFIFYSLEILDILKIEQGFMLIGFK
jgi:hypothetical protein